MRTAAYLAVAIALALFGYLALFSMGFPFLLTGLLTAALSYTEMKRLVDDNDHWLRGLGAAYERISCPVLLVMGSRPDRVPQGIEIREAVRRGVQVLQEAYPDLRVEWLPCGHFAPLERLAEVAVTIERFAGSLD